MKKKILPPIRNYIFSFAIGYAFIKAMSSPFSIPDWNISEIKNSNGTRESVGQKQKNVSKKGGH